MSDIRRIPILVLGVGNVGRAFLEQVTHTREHLAARYGVALVPVALADSSGAVFAAEGLSDERIAAVVAAKQDGTPLAAQADSVAGGPDLIAHAAAQGVERAVVVDTTAAEGMVSTLSGALERGYSVALANKRPLAGPWEQARVFFNSSRARFEATVGAGLPIVATLRYLVDTGDTVQHIEGALSGTLGYLCSHLEDGEPFSSIVSRAHSRAYTEPDPREDLSGMDVARKALILARLAGWALEQDALRVDPLYPTELASLDVAEFMNALPRLDADFAAYINAFGGVPRYMAQIRPNGGMIGLRMVGEKLSAQLRGTLNQVSITTERYADLPLTLIGPGAGLEVTAAAVLQDCILLARSTV